MSASTADLSVQVGAVALKNPIIAGSGEHLQTTSGIRAALAAGAAVVVAKSINETAAAREQLERAEYRLLDERWESQPWTFRPPVPPYMLSRSGLVGRPVDDWVAEIGALDREAARDGAFVAGSLVLADLAAGLEIGRKFQAAGVRIFEFNIGTPYGDEARVVTTERSAERVRELVREMRRAVDRSTLWVKLTSLSENVAALAAAARDGGADAVVMIGRPLAMLPDLDTLRPIINTNAAYGGHWALPLACYWLARSRKVLGSEVPLVGTSGTRNGGDVARMLLAGASAVEMCSAVMTGGFRVIGQAVEELADYVASKGGNAAALIGRAADALEGFGAQPLTGSWRGCVPPESLEG